MVTIPRLVTVLLLAAVCGCGDASESVVVYCSVDEAFSRRIFEEFQKRTGLRVKHVIDGEAGKTTGLLGRIRAERNRPRADVLFSSELFGTIRLAERGYLAAYDPPAASDIPLRYRDGQHRWTAIGLRGRVLAFDPKRTRPEELPRRWEQLAESDWAPHVALANPLFGTTRGHVAAMFALWGENRAAAFLTKLRDAGALIVDGNSAAVRAVISGRVKMCMTDTDDVRVAQRDGASVELKYLDMGDGGTLWIPSSVALIQGGPNQANAKRLVDYLVSADVERMLAESDSGNVPVRGALRESLGLSLPPASAMEYGRIASSLDESGRAVREILLR